MGEQQQSAEIKDALSQIKLLNANREVLNLKNPRKSLGICQIYKSGLRTNIHYRLNSRGVWEVLRTGIIADAMGISQ